MRLLFLKVLYPLLALSSFINPFYGVLNYTFISVIRPEQLTYGIPIISDVFALAATCLFISSLVKREKILKALNTSYFKFYLLFIVALYIATWTSPYTAWGARRGSFYFLNIIPQNFAFCLCLYAVLLRLKKKEIQLYVTLTIFFFFFMAVWGMQQYFFTGNTLVENLFGTAIIDRDAITGVFVLVLPLSLYFVKKPQLLFKIFGTFCFIAFLSIIIMGKARAGFLGTILSMFAVFYFSKHKARMAVLGVVFILFSLPFIPKSYFARMDTIKMQKLQQGLVTDYSAASRWLMWKVGLRMFADHPLMGVGFLNFSKANKDYESLYEGTVDDNLLELVFGGGGWGGLGHPHNTYINTLVSGGLLAAIPFYLILLLPLWKGYKLNKKYRDSSDEDLDLINFINCGIIGFLVTAFFAGMILIDFIYWFLTLSFFLSQTYESKLNTRQE